METKITTLSVIDQPGGTFKVVNSNTDTVYGKISRAISSGGSFSMSSRPGSGAIGITVRGTDQEEIHGLLLHAWKDGTIQFKINTGKQGTPNDHKN